MKMKFEVTVTRGEYVSVVKHMEELMDTLHRHFPTLPMEKKSFLKEKMRGDLMTIPGITVKSKNRFGGYLFNCGLKDELSLVLEVNANEAAIAASFDLAEVMADVFGPFANAAMLISNGGALKDLKVAYGTYARQSKPESYSYDRKVVKMDK